jgi:hypothetical protein
MHVCIRSIGHGENQRATCVRYPHEKFRHSGDDMLCNAPAVTGGLMELILLLAVAAAFTIVPVVLFGLMQWMDS